MAGDKVCDASNNAPTTVLLRKETLPCDSIWIHTSSASLHDIGVGDKRDAPFFQSLVKEENDDEDYDVCLNPAGKKRRLTTTQVQFLERNFEVENRLEPERKIQLAKELGLQPRQVAIWFQNRRARFKNKQLEKDYGRLKASYDKLKEDYDSLLKEKDNLKNEFVSLTEKLLAKEQGLEHLDSQDAINSLDAEPQNPTPKTLSENGSNAPKKKDASSSKGNVFDSDSPRSFLEPADSSNVFEADQSDVSQDEEDELRRSFLSPPCFPKLYHDPSTDSCSFEFPVEDQAFWCWSY